MSRGFGRTVGIEFAIGETRKVGIVRGFVIFIAEINAFFVFNIFHRVGALSGARILFCRHRSEPVGIRIREAVDVAYVLISGVLRDIADVSVH